MERQGKMTLLLKRLTARITMCVAALLSIFLICSSSSVSASVDYKGPYSPIDEIHKKSDVSTVMSVLKTKTDDQKLLDKAREKLSAMNDKELRLLVSLCDRIRSKGDTAGADIAFCLITTMLILS